MRVRGYLLLGLILASPAASAICIDVPLEQQITKASTGFVATITGASLRPELQNLHDQQAYTVHYTFAVAKIFKGDPAIVATLTTGCITVVAPGGEVLRQVPVPDSHVTNICFGGPDLRTAYMTFAGLGQLASMPWPEPGLALNFDA